MARSDEQLLAALVTLEKCRASLVASGSWNTARLLSVAILDLRMTLNRVGDQELKALCDEMLPLGGAEDRPSVPAAAGRPPLRLVK